MKDRARDRSAVDAPQPLYAKDKMKNYNQNFYKLICSTRHWCFYRQMGGTPNGMASGALKLCGKG